jgi:hypothetical protein
LTLDQPAVVAAGCGEGHEELSQPQEGGPRIGGEAAQQVARLEILQALRMSIGRRLTPSGS